MRAQSDRPCGFVTRHAFRVVSTLIDYMYVGCRLTILAQAVLGVSLGTDRFGTSQVHSPNQSTIGNTTNHSALAEPGIIRWVSNNFR